jgi:hypothetical protein
MDFTDEDIITLYLVTMTRSLTMSIAPKSPAQGHWDALKTHLKPLGEQLMELDEFLKHWNVSREELAFICDCSLTTVIIGSRKVSIVEYRVRSTSKGWQSPIISGLQSKLNQSITDSQGNVQQEPKTDLVVSGFCHLARVSCLCGKLRFILQASLEILMRDCV